MECSLPLTLGRNIVLATIVDAAGNSASAGARLLRITSDDIALTVTPVSASILVDEQRVLTAVDQFGRLRPEVMWSSSDELVAEIATDEDGVVSAAGVASGTATITATLGSETATMALIVYTGSSLPTGTPRWAAPSRGGIVASDTIIAGTFGGADAIYSIEYATPAYAGNKDATVRAYGVDGSENWFGALPVGSDEVVTNVLNSALGGVVAVLRTYSEQPIPAAVIRYTGESGGNWRYQSGAWQMKAVTGGDGTVFVVEDLVGPLNRSQVVVLNGATGAVIAKQLLPQFIQSVEYTAPNPLGIYAFLADPVGFVADSRGHARFLLTYGQEYITVTGIGGWTEYNVDLYDAAPDGSITSTQLDSVTHNPSTSYYYVRGESLTPDDDGVLAVYIRQDGSSQDVQWKGKYFGATNGSFDLPGPWKPTVSTHDGFGIGRGTEIADPLVARNLRTGALHWQSSAEGNAILALDGGGGVIADTAGGLRAINPLGASDPVEAVGATAGAYAYGRFHVQGANGAIAAISWKPLDDATAFTSDGSAPMVIAAARYGVIAKSHYVVPPYKHAAIRIVPRNQDRWLAATFPDGSVNPWRTYFAAPKMRRYGELAFATIGGGPSGGSWLDPLGYLETRFNSDTDINKDSVDPIARLSVGIEDTAIAQLFSLASAFDNQTLDYEPTPQSFTDGYNSNSYLRGLLRAAQLPEPAFPMVFPGESPFFPGWFKPVPNVYFGVQP